MHFALCSLMKGITCVCCSPLSYSHCFWSATPALCGSWDCSTCLSETLEDYSSKRLLWAYTDDYGRTPSSSSPPPPLCVLQVVNNRELCCRLISDAGSLCFSDIFTVIYFIFYFIAIHIKLHRIEMCMQT